MGKKWKEIFSQGDTWYLHDKKGKLVATSLTGDASDYPDAYDNGVSDIETRAREMGKKVVKTYEGNLTDCAMQGGHWVKGFTKKDGTYVRGFCRKMRR